MNYCISSSKFGNGLLKGLLQELSKYFKSKEVPFYVIGATARDIVIRQFLDQESSRRTRDLDIAIAIPDWDKYEEISTEIANLEHFQKSSNQKQRFYYRKVYELDIVPFGKVARENEHIYWPPEEEVAMSVQGFDEALKDFMTVRVDDEFDIRIASLSGLFLLKLNAWMDRHGETGKDAEDLYYILDKYYDVFEDRNRERDYHQEVYDLVDFDIFVVGAIWLGYDIEKILSKEQIRFYNSIITSELSLKEDSVLINQMLKQNGLAKYDVLYKALSELSSILGNALNH